MRFPRFTVRIWAYFSAALFLYSFLQAGVFGYQLEHIPYRELLRDNAAIQGTLFWFRGQEKEVRAHMRSIYFPEELIARILAQAESQGSPEKEYRWSSEWDRVDYLLEIGGEGEMESITLSYLWGDANALRFLMEEALISSLFALLIMLIPAFLVARGIADPLLKLEEHALRIAGRDLSVPIELKRRDEIGDLGRSLEEMRLQLREQDQTQQRLFQSVSHEMKTPVMVIRSHVQAIEDGIGTAGQNLAVIDEEAVKLGVRIAKLVSLSKLGYLGARGSREELDLAVLAGDILNRLSPRIEEGGYNPEWTIRGEAPPLVLNRDLMTILLENVLDNQIRYARSRISVDLMEKERQLEIRIGNDGPPLKEGEEEKVFDLFYKGEGGSSGLGLSIALEICLAIGGTIAAERGDEGPCFIISLPIP